MSEKINYLTFEDLLTLVENQAGLIIDVIKCRLSYNEIVTLARKVSVGNCHLVISNFKGIFDINELKSIAAEGKGCVTFDIADLQQTKGTVTFK